VAPSLAWYERDDGGLKARWHGHGSGGLYMSLTLGLGYFICLILNQLTDAGTEHRLC